MDELYELGEVDGVDELGEVGEVDEQVELGEVDEVESPSSSWMKYFLFKTWSTSFVHQSEVVH